MEITKESSSKVKELTDAGWQFMLHYSDEYSYECDIEGSYWCADFTRKLPNRLYDNHKSGYSLDPNKAIEIAYHNIKNGIRNP
jgi:hypothetical protein